jgi:hypothetical protein
MPDPPLPERTGRILRENGPPLSTMPTADNLGDRPAVFARQFGEHPAQEPAEPAPGLDPGEPTGHPIEHPVQHLDLSAAANGPR